MCLGEENQNVTQNEKEGGESSTGFSKSILFMTLLHVTFSGVLKRRVLINVIKTCIPNNCKSFATFFFPFLQYPVPDFTSTML
ncbi:hypothetical protein GDO78_006875 [Eleutherodactylus coqui]|uniref:Uncharacterized protein n=1 Tax=Eleutherodactylus coqui TaxID=57060 RepID=A0A8J6KBZ9_ELECQ|nr:hypothetical protein GDO78_006875 [Eleutherodactylus coqui]